MRAVFIRHGQSTGNAGIPSDDLSAIQLTELGRQQAREVAASWRERPTLIVTSPYVRAQHTAEPTRARFPNVPVEVWPIHEFTYLDPVRWNGTLSTERRPHIDRYWREADPMYCDGEEAESFSMLIQRAEGALMRLVSLPEDALVYIFSHGQFIQIVNLLIRYGGLTDREIMRMFPRYSEEHPIHNGQKLEFWANAEGDFHVGFGSQTQRDLSDDLPRTDASSGLLSPDAQPQLDRMLAGLNSFRRED